MPSDGDMLNKRDAHIHKATVDVAKFLEAKEPRAMSRVIECEALKLMPNHD